MTNAPPYTLTNESITVIWEGKSHVVQKTSPNFLALRKAISDQNWDEIPKNLTVAKSVESWAKGEFTLKDGNFHYKGMPLPSNLNQRITSMASRGEDPAPFFKFWERLQKNPSFRSVQQLWGFLDRAGIPLTKEGTFLAYKSVRDDFKDHHSNTFDNSPGQVLEMPRNQISDDPELVCHIGFHVGALEYARGVMPNGKIVVCEIDPEHVVCVPKDYSQQKMRVCKYKVIGHHNGSLLPSTTFQEDAPAVDIEVDDDDIESDEIETSDEPPEQPDHSDDGSVDEGADGPTDPAKDELTKIADATATGHTTDVVKSADGTVLADRNKKVEKRTPKKGFTKLDRMNMEQLLERSIDELRHYATYGLEIVGASKIPGGKVALVSKILEIRA